MGLRKAWQKDRKGHLLSMRRKHIRTNSYNVNVLNDLECKIEFRFKKQHIGTVCKTTGREAGQKIAK